MNCFKYLLFVIVVVFIFSGCNGSRMGNFTQEELEWLVYEKSDTLSFSNNGNESKLVVDYRDDFTQVRNYYPIEAEIELFNPEGKEQFRIYLLKDEKAFKKFFRLAKVYRSFDLTQPVDTVTVNDKIYTNVYIFQEDTSEIDSDVWRVYFNKDYGVIRYDKRGEGAFELIPEQDPV